MKFQEKALTLCQSFGYLGLKSEQTNYVTLDLELAKQCALISVQKEYEAKIEAYNELSEFCPDVAAQAVFYAKYELDEVKRAIQAL